MSIIKKGLVPAFLLVMHLQLQAQILEPAHWSWKPSKTSVKVGDEIDIIFDISIDQGWYVYTIGFDADCGPILADIHFDPDKSYQLVGGLKAIGDKVKHDHIFDCDVRIFEDAGQFIQRVKILAPDPVIKGTYEGQVCSTVEGKCVPFDGDFTVGAIQVAGGRLAKPKTQTVATSKPPQDQSGSLKVDTTVALVPPPTSAEQTDAPLQGPHLDPSITVTAPQQKSLWSFLVLCFLAGIAALITPCVFPMIPMTVTYFTGRTGSRYHALVYGLSIVVIYTIAGGLVSAFMGPEFANWLATEWIPNLFFFLVFVLFGLSFLGLFEITISGTFITKMDQKADKGGLVGIFFMAFTLVLVSFSCTGPIVGSILVTSAGGISIKPFLGMMVFSIAFAIPFTLFAFFPGWLNKLPKSGGWLNAVKVVLGFLELALALKFLSIADQAFHWRILDREVNIAIWIVIFSLIGIYLMHGFSMPGDVTHGKEPEHSVSVPRVILAIITFSFVVYLIPGMWGAPLKALAGYLPPMYTHDFNLAGLLGDKQENALCDEPKYADFLHLPNGLNGYFDYKQAMACARKQNKPLFIDFTGHGCTNCREMEAVVWSDPQVLERLKNDYVIVALYVDDKTELPASEWYVSHYDGKTKKTIGKQNADLQIDRLQNNAQPFYVLVGKDERVLAPPYGYDKSVQNFVKFLDAGKKRYRELYLN